MAIDGPRAFRNVPKRAMAPAPGAARKILTKPLKNLRFGCTGVMREHFLHFKGVCVVMAKSQTSNLKP